MSRNNNIFNALRLYKSIHFRRAASHIVLTCSTITCEFMIEGSINEQDVALTDNGIAKESKGSSPQSFRRNINTRLNCAKCINLVS